MHFEVFGGRVSETMDRVVVRVAVLDAQAKENELSFNHERNDIRPFLA